MIGAHIQTLRHQKRMSLTELATRAGVAKSYLSSIERDIQSNPSIQFLRKLAPVLGVNVQTLILYDQTESGAKTETLDQEWVQIIQEFHELGLSKDSLRKIVRQMKTRQSLPLDQSGSAV